jgi:hypothetical protein
MEGLDNVEEVVRRDVAGRMDRLFREAQERRRREVGIKREWLTRSFAALIAEADARLMDYERRKERGEEVRLAMSEEEKRYKDLIRERGERLAALEREEQLTLH